jgi:hypothetical protein
LTASPAELRQALDWLLTAARPLRDRELGAAPATPAPRAAPPIPS